MVFCIGQTIEYHLVIALTGSADIKVVVVAFKSRFYAGDQSGAPPVSLLLQNSGCQVERAYLPAFFLADCPKHIGIRHIIHPRCRRITSHKGVLKELLYGLQGVVLLIVGQLFKLEYPVLRQPVSGIHIDLQHILRCIIPGPAVVQPVLGPIREGIVNQALSALHFLLNHVVPVQTGVHLDKGPVRVLFLQCFQ